MADPEHYKILKQGVIVWNKWREENPDIIPDLRNLKLRGTKLSRANFINVDLRMTDLNDADLCNANLKRANLVLAKLIKTNFTETDLSWAKIYETKLYRTNLTSAILNYTRIIGTIFWKTNIKDSNFENARLGQTIFVDVNLSSVRNLDRCQHSGPSSIDHLTLMKSENLSEVFLRGCGLPESFIQYMPSLFNQPFDFYSCFISYSHADKNFARRLHDALQGKGIRCWLDEHQLLPGQDIHDELDRGIRLWDKLLLCASQNSLTSWWVDKEINTAFEIEIELTKQQGSKVRALVPLNLDGYLFSGNWKSGKATEVKSRVAADFTSWVTDNQKFEDAFDRLVKSLQAETEGREPSPISKL